MVNQRYRERVGDRLVSRIVDSVFLKEQCLLVLGVKFKTENNCDNKVGVPCCLVLY